MELMTTEEVAAANRIPAATLRFWRSRGRCGGPPSFKLGRRVLYRRDQVESWVEARMAATSGIKKAV